MTANAFSHSAQRKRWFLAALAPVLIVLAKAVGPLVAAGAFKIALGLGAVVALTVIALALVGLAERIC